MPVTIPVEPTVILVDDVLHVPPLLMSESESVFPVHTPVPPVMACIAFTVITVAA